MSSASLGATAAALWRDSPRWRWTVLLACALTGLALLGRMGGGAGTPQLAPGPQASQPPVIAPVPAQDQAAAVRLADFHKASLAAESIAAEGRRCEARAVALTRLHPGDAALAQGPQRDDLQKAQACGPRLGASDQRWNALAHGVSETEAAPSRAAVQELQAALGRLDAFDQTRSPHVLRNLPERIAALAKGLDDHDEAVRSLARQVALYDASAGTAVDAGRQVVEGVARLRSLPVRPPAEALPKAHADAIAAADRIAAELDASEQRLQTLAQAWQRRQADPQTVATLLSQLDGADRARWDGMAGRPAALAAMESAVAAELPAVLQRLLESYAREGTRVLAERIVAAQALGTRLGAPAPPPHVRAALDKVGADIESSRLRLARLTQVAQAWNAKARGARDAELEKDVQAAVRDLRAPGSAEINRYDAPVFRDAERRAWTTLHAALAEIQGTVTDPAVKLLVSVDAMAVTDRFLEGLSRHLGKALESAGFALSPSPEPASIRVAVSDPRLKKQPDPEHGRRAFALTLRPRVLWTYRGTETDLGPVTGIGVGDDERAAIEAAQVETARRIAEEIAGRTRSGT